MRYFLAAVALYLVVLATFDAFTLDGRFRKVVWQEAGYQAQRINAEVRHVLQKFGI
jgi:hypothetical protein